MRRFQAGLVVAFVCLMGSGCGGAKIKELTAEIESLKAKVADLEAKNAKLQQLEAENARLATELATAKKELDEVAAIKNGYEEARTKFAASLTQLAPLLGNMPSPLPPFEGLADSSWVGKFTPGAKIAPDLKELQNQLKDLLGPQGKQ
jgi:DNA repair exonuclease SbcCD ATPase subunit